MIIWGTRGRQIELSRGQFYCPRCDTQRQYKHIRVARYFTLFFIPLFQINSLGEYIECQNCHQSFKQEVLSYTPASPAEKLLVAVRKELETGTPVHMVQQKMIANNVGKETAEKLTHI